LQQLALPEHDGQLVLDAPAGVTAASGRLGGADEAAQRRHTPTEQHPADDERGGERDRGGRRSYEPLTLRISALIAGTTS
jgi:hypothetical protein